jgi:hypothetical protein
MTQAVLQPLRRHTTHPMRRMYRQVTGGCSTYAGALPLMRISHYAAQ